MIAALSGHRDHHPSGKLFHEMKYYHHNRSLHFTELPDGLRQDIDMIAGDMSHNKETFYPEIVTLKNSMPAGTNQYFLSLNFNNNKLMSRRIFVFDWKRYQQEDAKSDYQAAPKDFVGA